MSTLTTNRSVKVHQHGEGQSGSKRRLTGNRLAKRRRASDIDTSSLTMRVRI